MKIDEIINEAPLDGLRRLGRGLQGAKQGYQASQARRASAKEAQRIGKLVYNQWLAQQGRLQTAGLDPHDPQTLKRWLSSFLKGMTLTAEPPANLSNARQVSDYITQQTAAYQVQKAVGTQQVPAHAQQPAQAQPAPEQPGGIEVPAGERLVIVNPATGGKYIKTQAGWMNELGQKITEPAAVQKLEQYADGGGARMEKIPVQQPKPMNKGPQQRRGKGRR